MNHLDADTLTDLGGALQWRPDALDHVMHCAECREQFRQLAAMHGSLDRSVPMRAGFADSVIASLSRAQPAPQRSAGLAWSTARMLLGAGLGVVALGLAAGQGAPLLVGPVIVGVAALAGALAAWWAPASLLAE